MANTRKLYQFDNSKKFVGIINQGHDPQATKREGKITFANMPNATEIAPPSFDYNLEKVIFKNGKWNIEDVKIKGVFYLKTDASKYEEIAIKEKNLYTEITPLQKYEDGTTQSFEGGKWNYIEKGKELQLIELKKEKLKELQKVYNESRKITIQNGKTLIINHDTPERKFFLENLPKLPNWNEISFFGNYEHSILDYWQTENGKTYVLSADSIIWSEVFNALFIDKKSKKLIFAQNKKFYDIYKNQILNAKSLLDLNNLSFESISKGIVINIKNEAEKILKKFKPNLLSITKKNDIKKTITEAVKRLQNEDGEIHLIKEL